MRFAKRARSSVNEVRDGNRRALVVFPCCGLCNRIQVVACATLLAADTGRDLYVNWLPQHDCGAGWDDLFVPGVRTLEDLPTDAVAYSSVQRHPAVAPARYAELVTTHARERFGGLTRDPARTLAVFSCHQFLGYFHDPRFGATVREFCKQVRPDITQVVADFRAQWFGPRTVGVHIRRGDWRGQRGLDFYFDAMRKAGDATFFVSTDEPELFAAVQQRFPRAVRYPAASFARGDAGAVREALIDVLLLSSTSFLIGTPGSSFSAMAQVIGDIPGNFDYGYSMSKRDLLLGNLSNPGRVLWGRLRRGLRVRAKPG
jgi:hypothetical protein